MNSVRRPLKSYAVFSRTARHTSLPSRGARLPCYPPWINQGDFPFLFVQLAGFTAPDSNWPELREAQRRALGTTNTGMVVAVDLGERDSIHPKNKQEVGRRLSLLARAVVYGEQLVYSGPLFRRATREDGVLRIWFDHAGGGLVARGGSLRGVEVAGADRLWGSISPLVRSTAFTTRAGGAPRSSLWQ